MDILRALFPCFGASHNAQASNSDTSNFFLDEKAAAYTDAPSDTGKQFAANETGDKILHFIITAPTLNTPASNARIQNIISSDQPGASVSSAWWRNAVFKQVYNGLKVLVTNFKQHGEELSDTLRTLLLDAEAFAEKFKAKHPRITFLTELVALALLIEVLTPALLGFLGFCGDGIVGGSFAAWWQSTLRDVPYGSLFSKLQSFAARYGKHLPDVASAEN